MFFSLLALASLVVALAAHEHSSSSGSISTGSHVNLPATLRLDRVRFCRKMEDGECKKYALSRRSYRPFVAGRLQPSDLEQLYISQVASPKRRREVRHLVATFTGQQLRGAEGSEVTGQQAGFNGTFGPTDAWKRVPVGKSMQSAIMGTGFLPKEHTSIVSVFAPRFNFEYPLWYKNRIVAAYTRYLAGRMGPKDKMQTVTLVGHSRGGCLILRVAVRLIRMFPETRFFIQALDPICTTTISIPQIGINFTRPEFGVTAPFRPNPLNPKYLIYSTNMKQRFRSKMRACLYISSFVSGEAVVFPFVRGFGHSGFINSTNTVDILRFHGKPFYRQQFFNKTHTSITVDMFDRVVSEFTTAMNRFPSTCHH